MLRTESMVDCLLSILWNPSTEKFLLTAPCIKYEKNWNFHEKSSNTFFPISKDDATNLELEILYVSSKRNCFHSRYVVVLKLLIYTKNIILFFFRLFSSNNHNINAFLVSIIHCNNMCISIYIALLLFGWRGSNLRSSALEADAISTM
jgi:hypothetical protein